MLAGKMRELESELWVIMIDRTAHLLRRWQDGGYSESESQAVNEEEARAIAVEAVQIIQAATLGEIRAKLLSSN